MPSSTSLSIMRPLSEKYKQCEIKKGGDNVSYHLEKAK